jgi:hypothetical protein
MSAIFRQEKIVLRPSAFHAATCAAWATGTHSAAMEPAALQREVTLIAVARSAALTSLTPVAVVETAATQV